MCIVAGKIVVITEVTTQFNSKPQKCELMLDHKGKVKCWLKNISTNEFLSDNSTEEDI